MPRIPSPQQALKWGSASLSRRVGGRSGRDRYHRPTILTSRYFCPRTRQTNGYLYLVRQANGGGLFLGMGGGSCGADCSATRSFVVQIVVQLVMQIVVQIMVCGADSCNTNG